MNLYNIEVGDLIVREKGPFSTHFMVYLGFENGLHYVAENQSGHGVRIVELAVALAGNSIKRFEKFGGSNAQRALVLPKVKSLLQQSYDLIAFNCEHFARFIASGKPESKQVKVASNIALLTGATLLASKSEPIKILGGALLVIGIIAHAVQR